MPAPKSKTNGAGAKAKPEKSAPSTNGTTTPVPEAAPSSSGGFGKPDKAAYDSEQEDIKKQIDAIQTKLVRFGCTGPYGPPLIDISHPYSLLSRRRLPTAVGMKLPLPARGS
jgi:hypothetical protein